MCKLDKVAADLLKRGWIDGKRIQKITGTTCSRDWIYKLKERRGIITIGHTVTPTYTRWLLGTIHDSRKRA